MLSKGLILCMLKEIQEECQEESKLMEKMMVNSFRDVMEVLKNISSCLASFTPRFESYVGRTPPSKDLT